MTLVGSTPSPFPPTGPAIRVNTVPESTASFHPNPLSPLFSALFPLRDLKLRHQPGPQEKSPSSFLPTNLYCLYAPQVLEAFARGWGCVLLNGCVEPCPTLFLGDHAVRGLPISPRLFFLIRRISGSGCAFSQAFCAVKAPPAPVSACPCL